MNTKAVEQLSDSDIVQFWEALGNITLLISIFFFNGIIFLFSIFAFIMAGLGREKKKEAKPKEKPKTKFETDFDKWRETL